MQIVFNEKNNEYEVYKYKKKIDEADLKKRQEDFYEFDASIEAWNSLYLKVYSKIDIFRNNFDFCKPMEQGKRIVIPAKKDSSLIKNYRELWKKNNIPGEPGDFYISGDCDFKYSCISDEERHHILNISLLPVTGSLNDEKGSKGSINDVFSDFIKNLPTLIEKPSSIPGNYKLKDYKTEIVKCARKAYFRQFDDKIENYFYYVSFWGINEYKSKKEKELFGKVVSLLNDIKEKNDINEENLAKRYWELRREILKEKYKLSI